jgi:hypothetical protein
VSDYTVGDTLYALFTTRSFSTGAPTQLAGTPVVSAYENESLTQITSGVTLGVDHDSVTGLNLVTVVASGANGFETGKDYHLVITTGTVGGVSVVGEVVFRFTLARSAAAVDLANGTDGLGAIKTDTAAILVDTAVIGSTGQGLTSLATQASVNTIDDFLDTEIAAILSDTNAILVDTGTTLQAELDAIEAAVITNAAGVDIAADIIALKAETAAILVDTGTTLDAALAVVDGNVDSILVDTAEIGAAGAGLTALATQASVDTIDGIVDAILLDTAEIGAAGAGLTALATQTSVNTVDTVVDAIKVQTDKLTFTVANQVDANVQSINDVALTGDGSATPFNV